MKRAIRRLAAWLDSLAEPPCPDCGAPMRQHVNGKCPVCENCGRLFRQHFAGRCVRSGYR